MPLLGTAKCNLFLEAGVIALGCWGADACRLQQEVASHQATICKLLDEKAAALEELSRRTQALDAATAEIRQLNAAVRDREQLQVGLGLERRLT